MELTHFGHACLLMQTTTTRLLIDPGILSAGFEPIRDLDAVLITHQHADHLDLPRLVALLADNPQAALLVDAASGPAVDAAGLAFDTLRSGTRIRVGGSMLDIVGGVHATVHPDIPVVPNCALVFDDGAFYHPGDSYFVPSHDIDVLGVPVSGPWLKIGDAIDFLRAVAPRAAVPMHEAALADPATHLGMLTKLAPAGTVVRPLGGTVPTAF